MEAIAGGRLWLAVVGYRFRCPLTKHCVSVWKRGGGCSVASLLSVFSTFYFIFIRSPFTYFVSNWTSKDGGPVEMEERTPKRAFSSFPIYLLIFKIDISNIHICFDIFKGRTQNILNCQKKQTQNQI